ncbi:MAG TPA: urea ABC transporter ATP-binding subunit UrtE [Candidatus Acidoferrales bacterium]|nr:urea ABC transporter ATP-binding subunit UrtE [Candidatus Acidoferrales bacterium]
MPTAHLRVEGLDAAYGETRVLRNVTLEVALGEVVCLIGRNGVGKTTLLKSIVGLVPAIAGNICLGDREITRMPTHQRARLGIGYVPQGREIFPTLSVRENLTVAAEVHERSRRDDSVWHLFAGLEPMLHRRGGDLSGGQQQQLAIARALVGNPTALLLDEPTEGIQPSIIDEIENAIVRIKERGTVAILLVEQYLQFALRLADRYYVMEKGSIVAEGTTSDATAGAVERYLTI